MKKIYLLLSVCFLLSACGEEESTDLTPEMPADNPQEEFFATLFSHCGETYEGEATFPDDPDHTLVDTDLKATISTCTEERIEIDLVRGEETWHVTWVLEKRDEGLHLSHDHVGEKDEDELGEDQETGYGGYANDQGSSTTQYFPADEYTAENLPEASNNVWMIELDPDEEEMVYYLERDGEPRFRAELSKLER